ncbi:MAG: hypothetical protein H0W72_02355 [Planctomycetes bacterium]|nr:hypothetical protein [Planctomycetota bacterium]
MRSVLIIAAPALAAVLTACGGGSSSSGGSGPGGGGSTDRGIANSARLADLTALRSQCGGAALPAVTTHEALTTAAIKHAGWQALDDVGNVPSLNHGEPTDNALFVHTGIGQRIRAANGGADIPGTYQYLEDISSQHSLAAMNGLWNTVYHRVPMLRHRARRFGYGDMALARSEFPAANVPAEDPWGNPGGNGYATLEWAAQTTPGIALSYWPSTGTTAPTTFLSDSESPDPVPSANAVGPPLHAVFPTTADFATIVVDLATSGGVHVPVRLIVGGGTDPATSGDASNAQTVTDVEGLLDPGELFAIPLAPLAAGTSYTWSVSGTITGGSALPPVPAQTFTTP